MNELITIEQAERLQLQGKEYASNAYPTMGTAIILSASWEADNSADYPAYCDLKISGVLPTDRADVLFADIDAAESFGVSPKTETSAGKIRIRAVITPTVNLTVHYSIYHKGG